MVLLTILSAHGIDGVRDVLWAIVALATLSLLNVLGAGSLKRLWMDHTRMGYWLALVEAEMLETSVAQDDDRRRMAEDLAGLAPAEQLHLQNGSTQSWPPAGYFGHRHPGSYSVWKAEVHDQTGFSHRSGSWQSSRQRNVLFMRAMAAIYGLGAAFLAGAIIWGTAHDRSAMAHLQFLADTPEATHVVVDGVAAMSLLAPATSTPPETSRPPAPTPVPSVPVKVDGARPKIG